MRKMKKHRSFGLSSLVFLFCLIEAKAQGNFEDADKLSDLTSTNTEQHFDLRHTIPGIPEVDYPIYSHVPKTSFECTGRHEGYYADIESRCQAFRICTHTARSVSGFGFLCPNGTLFSQKYFVCDWYRNVNCDDSERFYSKNDINRVGSSFDMMETVRQMMEYPMKTISKALQQTPGSNKKPTQRHRGGNRSTQAPGDVSKEPEVTRGRGRKGSSRKSVTRDQVESAHNRGSTKYNKEKESSGVEQKEEVVERQSQDGGSEVATKDDTTAQVMGGSSSNVNDEVYVNSLGELSTDPGVTFDRTNAHIIAEPHRSYRYEKNMNFAEKVNAGLNDLIDLPSNTSIAPDYIKSLRDNKDDAPKIDLPSNINGLLDEISYDLNPSTSGYQVQKPSKAKHGFRFLSRGFSSQDDPYKYTKPKQTPSTVRFTPNQLPAEEEKIVKKPVLEIAPEAVPFGHSTITPETTEPTPLGDAIDYLLPPPELPAFEEVSYLSPPILEPTDTTVTNDPVEDTTFTTIPINTGEAEQETYTVTPETPTYAAFIETTTPTPTTETPILETPTNVPDIGQNLVASPQQDPNHQQKFDAEDTPVDEDRVDVNKQAENLFISGLQLTANEKNTEDSTVNSVQPQTPLLIQVAEDHSYLTAWVTSTAAPQTTEAASTTPENTIEPASFQERIRNYRRLANLQRSSVKPLIYGKRGGLRMTKMATPSSTTPKPTTTTKSYLKRIAASRLRLSRLAAAAGNKHHQSSLSTTPSISPVDNVIDPSNNINKKITVRNIDKDVSNLGNNIPESGGAKKSDIVTWESVKNSLQRFQVNRKSADDQRVQTTVSPQPTSTINFSSTTHNVFQQMRNRMSIMKPNFSKNIDNSSTKYETTKEPVTPTGKSISMSVSSSSSYTQSPSISFLNSIPLVPHFPSPVPTLSSVNEQSQNDITTSTTSSGSFTNGAIADKTILNSNSASAQNSFIPFDKLTRSIVDDSFLQNYRGGQILGRSSLPGATTVNSFQHSSNSNSRSPFGHVTQTPSRSTFSQSTPAARNRSPTSAPSQQIPPQRPVHQPLFSVPTVPTTSGPRIVVARAEGQRIEPNDVSSLISSLISQKQKPQPKSVHTTSYVPLNDFLTKKFGGLPINKVTQPTTENYNNQHRQQYNHPQNQQQQQQINSQQQQSQYQQFRQQYQQPQKIQQFNQSPQYQVNQQQQSAIQQQKHHMNYYQSPSHLSLLQPLTQTNYLHQDQPQNLFNQQSVAPPTQPDVTQNIFTAFKQQQQQLPPFPPLATQAISSQQSPQLLPQFDGNNNYLNVQLPTLTNGLIPAPTNQIAQKRSDYGVGNLELTDFAPADSAFNGVTSYDVPLNSIGRLPNDIQALYRRLRRY